MALRNRFWPYCRVPLPVPTSPLSASFPQQEKRTPEKKPEGRNTGGMTGRQGLFRLVVPSISYREVVTHHLISPWSAVLLVACAVACDVEPPPDVIWSTNPLWSESSSWTLGPEILRLGESNTEGHTFFRVRAAVLLPDDKIAIADDSHSIRVFDFTGSLEIRFGSYGSGPADFERINSLRLGIGDTLWVGDGQRRRVVGFSLCGEYLASYEIKDTPPFYGSQIIGFFEDGDPVLQGLRLVRPAAPAQVGPLPPHFLEWYRFDRISGETTYLSRAMWREEWAHEWMGGHAEGEPIFGARSSAAVGHDGLFVARGGNEFVVEVVNRNGGTSHGFGREVQLRAPNRHDREAYVARRLANAPPNADLVAWSRVFDDLPEREVFPAMEGIIVDSLGNAWVRHGGSPLQTDASWSVFRSDGRWFGDILLPSGLKPLALGGDVLLGRIEDELGVEIIVLHALIKPPFG